MTRHISITELARPKGSKRRFMTLLRAFCDASFTDAKRQPGITAIGGYVGTEEAWKAVEELWIANKKRWNLDEFSISRILAGWSSVGQSDAETCVRSFAKIINQSSLDGISAALNDADWEATYKSERFPDKYHACVSMLFHIVDQHVGLEFKGDTVEIILDTDRAPDAALNALVKEWGSESSIIASIAFGRRSQFPVLECADLCAGTERTSQIAGGWFGKNPKDAWNAISHAKKHRGTFWSLETARKIEEAQKERKALLRRLRDEGG